MGRAAVGLVLVVAAAANGAITRAQSGDPSTTLGASRSTSLGAGPGFLRRNFSPVTYLKASNPRPDAKLGFGSALTGRTLVMSRDGNTLAVAAPDEGSAATGINGNQKDDSANEAGAAYLFVRTGTTWQQQAYIKGSNTEAYDEFGSSLALDRSGRTLVISARGEDGGGRGEGGKQSDNSVDEAGAVYVFHVTR